MENTGKDKDLAISVGRWFLSHVQFDPVQQWLQDLKDQNSTEKEFFAAVGRWYMGVNW
jgi:hypothetical protein